MSAEGAPAYNLISNIVILRPQVDKGPWFFSATHDQYVAPPWRTASWPAWNAVICGKSVFVRTEQRKLVHRAKGVNIDKAAVDDALSAKKVFNPGIVVCTKDLGLNAVRARFVVSRGVDASHEVDSS